jgi:hypothetical protein
MLSPRSTRANRTRTLPYHTLLYTPVLPSLVTTPLLIYTLSLAQAVS